MHIEQYPPNDHHAVGSPRLFAQLPDFGDIGGICRPVSSRNDIIPLTAVVDLVDALTDVFAQVHPNELCDSPSLVALDGLLAESLDSADYWESTAQAAEVQLNIMTERLHRIASDASIHFESPALLAISS